MTLRELLIGAAVAAFALAALALGFAARAVIRRARVGKRRVWGGLVVRGILIAGLMAVGVAALRNLPPGPFVSRPAPVATDAIVVFHTQNADRGSDSETNIIEGVSARDGTVRWQRSLPAVVSSVIAGPPGVVFAAGADGARTLFAVRVADGALLWSRAGAAQLLYGYTPQAQVVTDGVRAFGLMQVSSHMEMTAIAMRDGATLWGVPIPSTPYAPTSLTLDNGTLFTAGADQPGNGWRITALRAADGAQLWTVASTGDPVTTDDRQPLVAASAGRVFVEPRLDQVTALDARTGAVLWSDATSGSANNPLTPQVTLASGDTLYIAGMLQHPIPGSRGDGGLPATEALARLVALDARTGAIHWSAPLDVGPSALSLNGPIITAVAAYGGAETLDAASGARLWDSVRTLANAATWKVNISQYAPLSTGGIVYVLNNEVSDDLNANFFTCKLACPGLTWLYAADARTGALYWRARMGNVNLTHVVF